jgi:exodeoxyribonuclease VII small subunit
MKFEEDLKKLEKIAEKMENPDTPLEKMLELYSDGIKLSKKCHDYLSEAEKKITEISKN